MSATVVEMLNVFSRSPPVPQTSSMGASGYRHPGAARWILARNSRAKAAISETASPLRASAVEKIGLDVAGAMVRAGQGCHRARHLGVSQAFCRSASCWVKNLQPRRTLEHPAKIASVSINSQGRARLRRA